MAIFEINAQGGNIIFAPSTVVEEVLQNIRTIITTIKGSVPLDREFGVSATFLDAPLPAAKAKLIAEIFEQIAKYEPRAVINQVSFSAGIDGILIPKVQVSINDN